MHLAMLASIALLHGSLALAVWRSKPDRRVNRLFAFQTLMFAGWTLGNALLQDPGWLSLGQMLAFGSASLIPPSMLMFIFHYPESRFSTTPRWQYAVLSIGLGFALVSLTTDLMVYDVRLLEGRLSRRAGVAYPFFVAYFIAMFIFGFTVFVRKWSRSKERSRAQLNYYGLGLVVAAIGGITSNLFVPAVTGSSSWSHLGPYFGLPLIVLTAHTIIRHRFMDLRIVVHRSLVVTFAVLLSSLPALAFFLLFGQPTADQRTLPEVLVVVSGFFVVALLIPLTRDVAERLLDRYLYRTRVDMRQLLRQASAQLARALDLTRVLKIITETIDIAVKPEGVAIYLAQEGALRIVSSDVTEAEVVFRTWPEPAPLVACALVDRELLVRDELDIQNNRVLRDALNASGWALVLQLFAENQPVGCIALGSKRSGDSYFSEDIDALTTLANHAGTSIKNAALYSEVTIAHEYLNNIVSAMQNGVVAINTARAVTLINSTAREILGVHGANLLKAADLPPNFSALLDEALDGTLQPSAREVILSDAPRSEPRLILCTAARLYGRLKDCVGVVAVFSDLTLLKELDQQRARAESLANIQRVTEALAHEIGNPLVPIKTLTRLLPQRIGDRTFAENVARIVAREIERIERLVTRLRRVAPTAEISHSRVDVRVPLRHALELVEAAAAQQDTRLEISVPDEPVKIKGDSAELEELFLNLLTNALEAVLEQTPEVRRVEVAVTVNGELVFVEVKDSGPGIPAAISERLFDPFVTTKARGSGLGLAICSGIAARHSGRLDVQSSRKGGAVFTLALPIEGPSG
jgi:nitrogen-specific signal transduction histidine kinase